LQSKQQHVCTHLLQSVTLVHDESIAYPGFWLA
jgi:hypothetical protein